MSAASTTSCHGRKERGDNFPQIQNDCFNGAVVEVTSTEILGCQEKQPLTSPSLALHDVTFSFWLHVACLPCFDLFALLQITEVCYRRCIYSRCYSSWTSKAVISTRGESHMYQGEWPRIKGKKRKREREQGCRCYAGTKLYLPWLKTLLLWT